MPCNSLVVNVVCGNMGYLKAGPVGLFPYFTASINSASVHFPMPVLEA